MLYGFNLRPQLAIRGAHGWLPSSNVVRAFYSLQAAARNDETILVVLVDGVRLTDRSVRALNAYLRYGYMRFNPYGMRWADFAELIDLKTMSARDSAPFQDEFVWMDAPVWLKEIRDVGSHR